MKKTKIEKMISKDKDKIKIEKILEKYINKKVKLFGPLFFLLNLITSLTLMNIL